MNKSLEDIKNELRDYITDYTAKIEMWEKVERAYKKNGEQFAILSKNFTNCDFYREYGDNKIRVCGRDAIGKHVYDYIIVSHFDYSGKVALDLTADEIESEIQKRIAQYKEYVNEHEKEVEMCEEYYNALMEKINDIHELFNSISDKGPRGRYKSLRYGLEDVLKHYYFS